MSRARELLEVVDKTTIEKLWKEYHRKQGYQFPVEVFRMKGKVVNVRYASPAGSFGSFLREKGFIATYIGGGKLELDV